MKPKILRLKVVTILLLLPLCSCVIPPEEDSLPFASVDSVQDLAGSYKNRGVSANGKTTAYLSRIIWPADDELDPSTVEVISVAEAGPGVLEVKALAGGEVQKTGRFVEGEDFTIQGDTITLERHVGMAGLEIGEPLVGPVMEQRTLGLDTSGHGKYRKSTGFVGMVFLLIPVAGSVGEDVRFERLP